MVLYDDHKANNYSTLLFGSQSYRIRPFASGSVDKGELILLPDKHPYGPATLDVTGGFKSTEPQTLAEKATLTEDVRRLFERV